MGYGKTHTHTHNLRFLDEEIFIKNFSHPPTDPKIIDFLKKRQVL